jgi:hypothetical protein
VHRGDFSRRLQCCCDLDMTRHIQPWVAVFIMGALCNACVGPKWGPDWQGYLVLMLTVDQIFSFRILDACMPLIGRSLHVDIA